MGENLFEEEFTIEALSQMGNPLERLSSLVDFEMFRPVLEDVLLTKECKTPTDRKPIDVVLMFKVIFLQRYYGLGDHQIQYQIIDRTSFHQFLGIRTVAEIPDEKIVWACRDKLSKAGTFDLLFDQFRAYLDSLGLSFNEGKIIDATFVEAPVSATPVKRTSKSKRATAAVFGSQRIATPRRRRSASLTSAATRTSMLAGRRNAVRITMATRITLRPTRRQSSSRNTTPLMPACMTPMSSSLSLMRRTRGKTSGLMPDTKARRMWSSSAA